MTTRKARATGWKHYMMIGVIAMKKGKIDMIGTLADMQEQFRNGTYDLTDNGKCTQCGECCSNILPMTDEEIHIIRKYIKEHSIKEHRHLLPLSEPSIDMTCPFLDDSKETEKCDIYNVRPRICREFICCPSKRKPLDLKWGLRAKVVDVRKTFF